MNSTQDTYSSSYREILLEHLFVGAIMKHLWLRGITQFEVLKPQVDDSGYDLVLEANGVVRHVQLKASADSGKTAVVKASIKLALKPSACVIWMHFNKNTMELGPYLWFGGPPGDPIPDFASKKVAKHTKANAQGIKLDRPDHRVLRRGEFEKVTDVEGLLTRLFGTFPVPAATVGLS